MRNPLISVIIPFFNRIEYAVMSIESVIEQTYECLEIIIVDDGSTEDTSPIEKIARDDDRIKIIHQVNQGVSAARNAGIKVATGEFIAFLDSDDLFMPNKIERQLSLMKKHNVAISHTSYHQIKMDGKRIQTIHSGTLTGRLFPQLIGCCPIATPTIMARREVFLGKENPFITGFHIGEDVCLWIDMAYEYNFLGIDEDLTAVRIGETTAAYDTAKQKIGLTNIIGYVLKNNDYICYSTEIEKLVKALQVQFDVEKDEQKFSKYLESKIEKRDRDRARKTNFYKKQGFFPLVSVIIPVFNGSDFLREAIESALFQTYPNVEIIVVNDGSCDNGQTERIALSFGNKIKYYFKENGGVASALNMGIEKMQGEYFSWLSHDDLYLPEKIENQINALISIENKKAVLAGGYILFNGDSGVQIGTMEPLKANTRERLAIPLFPVFRGMLNGCTMLIHKSHFERVGVFDTSLPTTQDLDLWFRICRGQSVYFLEGTYVKSRCHASQGSRQGNHIQECSRLWIKMMTQITTEEAVSLEGSRLQFYHKLYEFLESNTNYLDAISYARSNVFIEARKEYIKNTVGLETALNLFPCSNETKELMREITERMYIEFDGNIDALLLADNLKNVEKILNRLNNENKQAVAFCQAGVFPVRFMNDLALLWGAKSIIYWDQIDVDCKGSHAVNNGNTIWETLRIGVITEQSDEEQLIKIEKDTYDVILLTDERSAKGVSLVHDNCYYVKEDQISCVLKELFLAENKDKWLKDRQKMVMDINELREGYTLLIDSYKKALKKREADNNSDEAIDVFSRYVKDDDFEMQHDKTSDSVVALTKNTQRNLIKRLYLLVKKFLLTAKERGIKLALKKAIRKVKKRIELF